MKRQKRLRTAKFEKRAKKMGITERALIAQKVEIWEGMFAAEQHGDNSVVSILPLEFRGCCGNVTD